MKLRLICLIVGIMLVLAVPMLWVWRGGSSPALPAAPSLYTPSGDSSARIQNYSLKHSEKDTTSLQMSEADIVNAADFSIVFGDGSGLSGYNVLKVNSRGECQYTFLYLPNYASTTNESTQWRRSEFPIDAATLSMLRETITSNHILRLGRSYTAGVADGTQQFIKIQGSGCQKAIWCDNYFPTEVMALCSFVNDHILLPYRIEIDRAQNILLEPKDLESPDFDKSNKAK